jgi:hypothetical protein
MYQIPYLDGEEREEVTTKCTVCKEMTDQQFIKVVPMFDAVTQDDVLNLLKLAKRLVVCTECGTLRLIN